MTFCQNYIALATLYKRGSFISKNPKVPQDTKQKTCTASTTKIQTNEIQA